LQQKAFSFRAFPLPCMPANELRNPITVLYHQLMLKENHIYLHTSSQDSGAYLERVIIL